MKKLLVLISLLVFLAAGTSLAAPAAPEMSYSTNGLNITGANIPAAPRLTITIPDITLGEFSAPGAANFDFSAVGDLEQLQEVFSIL